MLTVHLDYKRDTKIHEVSAADNPTLWMLPYNSLFEDLKLSGDQIDLISGLLTFHIAAK